MTKADRTRPGERSLVLGVDAGGTFTDFVAYDGRGFRVHKVLSTPEAPERAILAGIEALGLSEAGFCIVHGTTVATNAVLEGKGARTCLVTNRGFRDLLTIGRQARRDLYDLCPSPCAPPVPRELCLEAGGRIGADGDVLDPVTEEDLAALAAAVRELGAEAVAIDCLFSYLDPSQERAIEAALPAGVFVSRSSEVLPERREYERGIATWLNAYTGPKIHGYLERLAGALPATRIAVMQSAGETLSAAAASRRAVHLLLSGPAGGVMGARAVARDAGHERFLTLDMGGTSTDVALVDGEVVLTSEGRLGPYPVAVPMVDIHSIGAGGGSIAYADAGGLLRVGPASAGADPGPACYGRGGGEPTVTDANLVLGRLPADSKLAGSVTLDVAAARAAVGRLAARLGMPVIEDVALGIVAIANEHMANALRVISLHRGLDPRRFPLFCFGGAGGLHVCDLARALGIRETLVPRDAGVLSALGMLAAPSGRQLSRTLSGVLTPARRREIGVALRTLAEEGPGGHGRRGDGAPPHPRVSQSRSLLPGSGPYPEHDLAGLGRARARRLPPGPRTALRPSPRDPGRARQPPGGAARTGRPTALGAASLGTPSRPHALDHRVRGRRSGAGLRARRAHRGTRAPRAGHHRRPGLDHLPGAWMARHGR